MLKITKLKAIVFIFWTLFFTVLLLTSGAREPIQLDFNLKVRASEKPEPIGRFYFDTGAGFNDEAVVTVSYEPNQEGQLTPYQLVIPEAIQNIKQVRFSPLNSAGEVVVKGIRLSKFELSQPLTFNTNPTAAGERQQIETLTERGDQVYMITSGETPYVILEGAFSYPFFSEVLKNIQGQDPLYLLTVIALLMLLSVVLTLYSTNIKKGERVRIP